MYSNVYLYDLIPLDGMTLTCTSEADVKYCRASVSVVAAMSSYGLQEKVVKEVLGDTTEILREKRTMN